MKRCLLVLCAVLFSSGAAFGAADTDPNWSKRNTPEGAKANYDYCKAEYSKNTNYLNAWKLSRAAQYYGDNYCTNLSMKLALFTEGKEMAETATNLKNDGVEGHYYLAVCLGQWGEANGVFQSLFAVPGILSEATKTIQLDPKFETAGGYMVRGRLYQQAPGGISVGDLKKSQADYEKALELAPNNRVVHRFYAELLISLGQKDKAKEVIEKGLAIPLNKNDRAIEEKEIGLLKALQKKL